MKTLTPPEHLLLLAMRDDKGSVVGSSALALPYGLSGAVILELSLRRRISVEGEILEVLSEEPTGDNTLDEALRTLSDCERERPAEYWIARPDSLVKNLKQRLLEELVKKGILAREKHKFLWLIPYDRFPELDGEPERNLRQHVNDVLFHGAEADEPTALLISLISACGLVSEVLPEADSKEAAARIKSFTEGSRIAKAVSDDVAAATIALVSSTIVASVIPTVDGS